MGGLRQAEFRLDTYVSPNSPIVIGGVPRSGTTLLSIMLNSHPELVCGPESGLLRAWPDYAKFKRSMLVYLWQNLQGWVEPERTLSKSFGMSTWEIRRLYRRCSLPAEFIDLFFTEYAARAGCTRWTEKSPGNVKALGFLFEHFPKAKFIHMIRDGRDVCCSYLQWFEPHYKRIKVDARFAAITWNEWIRYGRAYSDFPNYIEVRYEDLTAQPERVLRELFEKLELRWDPAVLEYHQRDHRNRPGLGVGRSAGIKKPVYTSSQGRWRRDLKYEDRVTFERISGSLLRELGMADSPDWVHEGLEQAGEPAPSIASIAPAAQLETATSS